MRDAFTSIARDACFHVACEQTHVLSPLTFPFSRQLVNIVFSVDGIRPLVDVIIVDPIRVDLVSHVALSQGVAKIVMPQTKEG